MDLYRRHLPALAASTLAVLPIGSLAQAPGVSGRLQGAIDRFAALPAASCLVVADHPAKPWHASHQPATRLFIGSAVKTFILAQCLRDLEMGRLAEETQMPIDDSVRSLSSPVFLKLTGTTAAVNVLEAMIAHSDNTATDVAIGAVGAERVRALIAQAGLRQTQIPDSTRRLFSYLAGAAEGVDVGIQAMADALVHVVPPDTVAYGKGGSIDWQGFYCFCLPGQMIVGKVPVTFCFTINWTGPADGVGAIFQSYKSAIAEILQEAAVVVG